MLGILTQHLFWFHIAIPDITSRNGVREIRGAPVHTVSFSLLVADYVTFGLNVRLDLSGKATTELLCALGTKLLLKILGEGTRTVAVWVIRGDEGVGDVPGVRGDSGESLGVLHNKARLTQELRLKV